MCKAVCSGLKGSQHSVFSAASYSYTVTCGTYHTAVQCWNDSFSVVFAYQILGKITKFDTHKQPKQMICPLSSVIVVVMLRSCHDNVVRTPWIKLISFDWRMIPKYAIWSIIVNACAVPWHISTVIIVWSTSSEPRNISPVCSDYFGCVNLFQLSEVIDCYMLLWQKLLIDIRSISSVGASQPPVFYKMSVAVVRGVWRVLKKSHSASFLAKSTTSITRVSLLGQCSRDLRYRM